MKMLFLRTYAECANEEAARDIQRRLAEALTRWSSPMPRGVVEPYYKIPAWYGMAFLMPLDCKVYDTLTGLAASDWSHVGDGDDHNADRDDRSAVWNFGGESLLVPELRWAELQSFDPDACRQLRSVQLLGAFT